MSLTEEQLTLTEEQLNLISRYPLKGALNHLCLEKEIPTTAQAIAIIQTLLLSDAAVHLAWRNDADYVCTRLRTILVILKERNTRRERYRPLVNCILKQMPSEDVWNAVLGLIADYGPRAYPPSGIGPLLEWKPAQASWSDLRLVAPEPSERERLEFLHKVYLASSVCGFGISEFKICRELLEALRDAIRAHQSLYRTCKISHRGISSETILILKTETAGGFKGMLNGLNSGKGRAGGQWPEFMAIEVLRGVEEHTYRHDLESFFYVLLWAWARHIGRSIKSPGDKGRMWRKPLRRWETDIPEDVAAAKIGDMTVNGLQYLMVELKAMAESNAMVEFEVMRTLCLRIRQVLFPVEKNGWMNIGTPKGGRDQLYTPIIVALSEAIYELKENEKRSLVQKE